MSHIEILVVGATGKQGGRVMATLLEAKQHDIGLRFLTRNESSPLALKLKSQGARAMVANLSDATALKSALQGVDRAFLVTDAGVGEESEAQQGINFIYAAKDVGVRHVVYTSVSAASIAKDVPHFRAKAKVEDTLKSSGLSYTILRPVAFMDNFPIAAGFGRFMVVGMFYAALGGKPCQLIATEDIGVFAGKALLDPTAPHFANKTIDLSGGNYSLDDVRQAVEQAQGSQPWFATYLPKAIRSALPYDFKQMMIYLEKTGYPDVDTTSLRKIHPGLLTLRDYFAQELPKANN